MRRVLSSDGRGEIFTLGRGYLLQIADRNSSFARESLGRGGGRAVLIGDL